MTSTTSRSGLRLNRRHLLAGAAIGLAAPGILRAQSAPFKFGVLLPFSAGMELFGQQGIQGVQMAVNEVNAAGGVLGRQIEIIQVDDRNDPRTAVERTTALIRRDEVNAIAGPITSANRDAIKSTIERAGMPLLYATDYEGGVCSDWIACYSPLPAHYVDPLLPWLQGSGSSSYYLFGADYTWPRRMNDSIRPKIAEVGGTLASEEYTPFAVKDYAPTLRKIRESGADTVILTLPGADGLTFVKQFFAAGMARDIRLSFLGFNENYLPGLSDDEAEGIIAPLPFMQTLDRPEAKEFIARQRAMFGDDAVVTYYAESHYGLTRFYLDAVNKADTDDKAAIMAALPGQSATFGNGEVYIRPEDKHVDLNILISSVQGGQLMQENYFGKVVAPSQCAI